MTAPSGVAAVTASGAAAKNPSRRAPGRHRHREGDLQEHAADERGVEGVEAEAAEDELAEEDRHRAADADHPGRRGRREAQAEQQAGDRRAAVGDGHRQPQEALEERLAGHAPAGRDRDDGERRRAEVEDADRGGRQQRRDDRPHDRGHGVARPRCGEDAASKSGSGGAAVACRGPGAAGVVPPITPPRRPAPRPSPPPAARPVPRRGDPQLGEADELDDRDRGRAAVGARAALDAGRRPELARRARRARAARSSASVAGSRPMGQARTQRPQRMQAARAPQRDLGPGQREQPRGPLDHRGVEGAPAAGPSSARP